MKCPTCSTDIADYLRYLILFDSLYAFDNVSSFDANN